MSALDDHLEPDERVLYRTGRDWKAVLWLLCQSIVIAAWVPILYWAIDYGGPSAYEAYEDIILAVLILGLVIYFALRDTSRITAVTERRVIKKTGVLTAKIEELAHGDVERLSLSWSGWPRSVIVHGRDEREIEIHAPLESDTLCRRVAEFAKVPAPAKPGPRIVAAGAVQTALAIAVPLVTASFAFKLAWILFDYHTAKDDGLTQLIIGLVMFSWLIPTIFSLNIGLYLGNLISMIVLRPILSASEAERVFATRWRAHMEQAPDLYAGVGGDVVRFGLSLKQAFLSRLYGKPVRLDQ